MMTRKEMIKWAKDTVDKIFYSREPRDNWEYIKEFCDKFGIPKDMDELDVLVSYVRDKKHKEHKPIDSEEKFESIDNAFRRGREVGFREGVESVKPSEEQMKQLEAVINAYPKGSRTHTVLESLYNDLNSYNHE